jgi:cold shock CspA family protein
MATGTVKWFNPSDGGRDIFVHVSVVAQAGLTKLVKARRSPTTW